MWIFKAKFDNMDDCTERTEKIEFDGDNFFENAKECYLYAMEKAFEMKRHNECFASLEFIAC